MAKNTPNQQGNRSLSEVHESVVVPSRGPWWRRWLAITGPALMAAVGRLHGSWQLGNRHRRRQSLQLHPDLGAVDVEPDGYLAAKSGGSSGHCQPPRSGPGLSRRISTGRQHPALRSGGDRHHSHRSGGGAWVGHRTTTSVYRLFMV